MVTVTATRKLTCDPKTAAKVLDDFPNIGQWSRGVAKSETVGEQATGEGAVRRCEFDAKGKQWVNEVLRERGDNTWVIDIVDGAMPMKYATATFSIEGAQASVQFDYAMGGIMAPMGLLMKGSMRKTFQNVLEDLDNRGNQLGKKSRKLKA